VAKEQDLRAFHCKPFTVNVVIYIRKSRKHPLNKATKEYVRIF
jgi:hypothetical protein